MTTPGDGGGGRRGVGRRSLLGALGAVVAGGYAVAAPAVAREPADREPEAFSVAQGDRCVPVVPLAGDEPVEVLYDYRVPGGSDGDGGDSVPGDGPYFQSDGTTDLQRRDVTVSFLYRGPGGLSLVVVHGCAAGSDGAGGAVTWTVEGVPDDAEWAVGDDRYRDPDPGESPASDDDRWDVDGPVHTVDWTWERPGTAGGALRTADPAPALTVRPAFNERAALWGDHDAGDAIREWQFLSFPAGRESPERTALALDEPVSVLPGPCDAPGPAGGEGRDDVVAVDLDLELGSLLLDPGAAVPVELRPEEPLEPDEVDEESLRLGPPDVVAAGGGARPDGGNRGDDLVYHFPVRDLGLGVGDTRVELVGRTVDGRPIVGTAGVSLPDVDLPGSDTGANDSDE